MGPQGATGNLRGPWEPLGASGVLRGSLGVSGTLKGPQGTSGELRGVSESQWKSCWASWEPLGVWSGVVLRELRKALLFLGPSVGLAQLAYP